MNSALVSSPAGVMTVLIAVVAFWFWLERASRWKLFNYLPPLIFIYATPVLLSNTGLIPFDSAAYDFLRHYGLPVFIVLMLIKVDVLGAVRIMGKGVLVMLIGSLGVVLGGVLAYQLGQTIHWPPYFPLPEDSWRAFGTLAGSWIGGTGNMTAAHAGLGGTAEDLTMAAAADQMVYLVWLPVLLASRAFAERFNRWMKVPPDRLARMERAAGNFKHDELALDMSSLVTLALLALGTTWVSLVLADKLPIVVVGGAAVITAGTWLILLVTTLALLASATPARKLPAAQPIAMAIIYVYVARVGATMDLSEASFGTIGAFVLMAYVWIAIHGLFILAGAWLFRVDVHTVAIASAALASATYWASRTRASASRFRVSPT